MEDRYKAKWVPELGSKATSIVCLAVSSGQFMWQSYLEKVASRKNMAFAAAVELWRMT
jgi:hypothetical protein